MDAPLSFYIFLKADFYALAFQVETLISMFPKSIIEHGKSVNKDIMDQLDRVAETARKAYA